MPRKKNLESIDLKNIMVLKTVDEVIRNKGHALYQCSYDFPYVVKTLNLLAKHSNLPSITFSQLEEALDMEDPPSRKIILQKVKSEFLSELYTKLMRSCRRSFNPDTLNITLYSFVESRLFYFLNGKNPFGEVRYEADVSILSSVEKLKILRALLDEKMNQDAAEVFDSNYTPDELRLDPLAVDRKNRKFWYFGDTYLFLEHKPSRRKSHSEPIPSSSKVDNDLVKNVDEQSGDLPEFFIVCKTSDDWLQLVNAYEMQKNAADKEVASILRETLIEVQALEKKRLRALVEVVPGSRSSSRIKQREVEMKEKLQKQIEEERLLDEILQTRRKRELEKDAENNPYKFGIKPQSRGDRYLRRQQLSVQPCVDSESTSTRNSSETPRGTSVESQTPSIKRARKENAIPKVVVAVENLDTKKASKRPSRPSSNETITSMESNQEASKVGKVAVEVMGVDLNAVLAGQQPNLRAQDSRMPNHVLYSDPSRANSSSFNNSSRGNAERRLTNPNVNSRVVVVRQRNGQPHSATNNHTTPQYHRLNQPSSSILPVQHEQISSNSKVAYYTTQGQYRIITPPSQRPIRILVRQLTAPTTNVSSNANHSPMGPRTAHTYQNWQNDRIQHSSQSSINGDYYYYSH